MKKTIVVVLTALLCLSFAASAPASEPLMSRPQGHYKAGPNAIDGAQNPPPGSNVIAVTLANSSFSDMRDNNGDSIADAPRIDVTVWAVRYIHMFEEGFFGGSSGFNIAVTGAKMNGDFNTPGGHISQTDTMLGDPNIELMQGWEWPQFALRLRVGSFLGLGSYSTDRMLNFGQDFWSFYGQVGGTFWFDQDRRFSATAIATYEANLKMQSHSVTPGNAMTIEGGAGVRILPQLTLALSAHHVQQITKDSGNDRAYADPDKKYRSTAIGPYARVGLPFIHPGAALHVTWWHTIDARNAPKGDMFFSEIQIPF